MVSVQLECQACGWRTTSGAADVVARLRKLGLFRRAPDPPAELVREVLRKQAGRLACDHCGAVGLVVNHDDGDPDADWEQIVVCEVCRQPIPPERLQYNPRATRCVGCQNAAERGQSSVEPEYCPKCGSPLELRVSRGGGITRYKQWCTGNPPCRL